jgi:hypothetical protein
LLVKPTPRNVNLGNGRFAMFNKERDISEAESPEAYYTKEDIEKYKDALVCLGCFQQAPRKFREAASSSTAQCKDRPVFSRWTSALLQRSLQ